jgi:aspartate/methionine/tyrosine aminotransferase
VTNGSMHGLFVTFSALLDPADEVILPDPMWTEVAENVRLAGGVAVASRCARPTGTCTTPTRSPRASRCARRRSS